MYPNYFLKFISHVLNLSLEVLMSHKWQLQQFTPTAGIQVLLNQVVRDWRCEKTCYRNQEMVNILKLFFFFFFKLPIIQFLQSRQIYIRGLFLSFLHIASFKLMLSLMKSSSATCNCNEFSGMAFQKTETILWPGLRELQLNLPKHIRSRRTKCLSSEAVKELC